MRSVYRYINRGDSPESPLLVAVFLPSRGMYAPLRLSCCCVTAGRTGRTLVPATVLASSTAATLFLLIAPGIAGPLLSNLATYGSYFYMPGIG